MDRRQTRYVALLITLITLAGCNAQHLDEPATEAIAGETENTVTRAEGLLFLDDDERLVAFANINQIAPTRPIKASGKVHAFGHRNADLEKVTYTVDGELFSVADFLSRAENRGFLVVNNNNILLEHYAPGHTEQTRWVSFSVTKSVTSMLIGAAIKDGLISSVDEPAIHYLPRLRGGGYEKASIKNILQMSSGVAWNEDYADPGSDVARAGGSNGLALVNYLAKLPSVDSPGNTFNYNTGETNLAGELLRSAIGNNAATYLQHKIWQPMGMEHDANWLLGSVAGGETGGCCISATLRDYARLGTFAMNNGELDDGTKVLPDTWMAESTAPSKGYEGYGYFWWLFGDYFSALGIFGQQILVDPIAKTIIAVHSNAPAAVDTVYHKHQRAVTTALVMHLRSTDSP